MNEQLLDDLLTQILRYKNQSEMFYHLSIVKNDKEQLLKISEDLNNVFKSFRYLIFTLVKSKGTFSAEIKEDLLAKINHLKSTLEEKSLGSEEKYKAEVRTLITNNAKSLEEFYHNQFEASKLISDNRYYVQLTVILDTD